uniref:PRC-barrel domain-containing protein n=1 Tax=Archaeoglobus fulgidus TaxID=2234 RepID=UPI0030BA2B4E
MIGEITTFFGMRVFTDEGRYVGRVEDVILDQNTKSIRGLAISDYNKALIDSHAKGVIIPYRVVKAVGDIIIIKDLFKRKSRVLDYESRELIEEEGEEGEEWQEMYVPARSLARKSVVLTDGTVVGTLYNITVDFKTGTIVNLLVKPENEIPDFKKEEGLYIIPFECVRSLKDFIVVDRRRVR